MWYFFFSHDTFTVAVKLPAKILVFLTSYSLSLQHRKRVSITAPLYSEGCFHFELGIRWRATKLTTRGEWWGPP